MSPSAQLQIVDKENIQFLKFPKEDVLTRIEDRKNRRIELQRAMSLGNLLRSKVRIIFQDDVGPKKVETTIWGITDEAVILKQSTIIPMERILCVA